VCPVIGRATGRSLRFNQAQHCICLSEATTKPFEAATVAQDAIYTARKDREDILSPFRSSAFEITDKKFRFPVN